jgi:hypothetical protein
MYAGLPYAWEGPMTDAEVISAVRRHLAGIETELGREQASGRCAKEQFQGAMAAVAGEIARICGWEGPPVSHAASPAARKA